MEKYIVVSTEFVAIQHKYLYTSSNTIFTHRKQLKMKKLIKYIQKMFTKSTKYGSDLENYINSKHPTSSADVEHWERQYQQKHATQSFLGSYKNV